MMKCIACLWVGEDTDFCPECKQEMFLVRIPAHMVSNCCGARVENTVCMDCKEHCEEVGEE